MSTTIRLEPRIVSRINYLSRCTKRPKALFVRELMARAMEDLEDYYSAHEVLARVRAGEEKVYSSQEVRKALGLDD